MKIEANSSVETDLQKKFWGSNHKCNKMKALIAFSKDELDFKELAKRRGYRRAWRNRAWLNFGQYVGQSDMVGIPFSDGTVPYWEEMPLLPEIGKMFK